MGPCSGCISPQSSVKRLRTQESGRGVISPVQSCIREARRSTSWQKLSRCHTCLLDRTELSGCGPHFKGNSGGLSPRTVFFWHTWPTRSNYPPAEKPTRSYESVLGSSLALLPCHMPQSWGLKQRFCKECENMHARPYHMWKTYISLNWMGMALLSYLHHFRSHMCVSAVNIAALTAPGDRKWALLSLDITFTSLHHWLISRKEVAANSWTADWFTAPQVSNERLWPRHLKRKKKKKRVVPGSLKAAQSAETLQMCPRDITSKLNNFYTADLILSCQGRWGHSSSRSPLDSFNRGPWRSCSAPLEPRVMWSLSIPLQAWQGVIVADPLTLSTRFHLRVWRGRSGDFPFTVLHVIMSCTVAPMNARPPTKRRLWFISDEAQSTEFLGTEAQIGSPHLFVSVWKHTNLAEQKLYN